MRNCLIEVETYGFKGEMIHFWRVEEKDFSE